jgi:hypothetical protein
MVVDTAAGLPLRKCGSYAAYEPGDTFTSKGPKTATHPAARRRDTAVIDLAAPQRRRERCRQVRKIERWPFEALFERFQDRDTVSGDVSNAPWTAVMHGHDFGNRDDGAAGKRQAGQQEPIRVDGSLERRLLGGK